MPQTPLDQAATEETRQGGGAAPKTSRPVGGPRAEGADMDALTPAMRQYVEQKVAVGDAILLFRMGDFYETFYEDAVLCSKVLGIALTSRNKGENPIPLAGIPYHALNTYLARLVAAGYRVAVSEQVEDPREAKGVIRREISRIVTAGTLTDEGLLDEREDRYLAALVVRGDRAGLAWMALSGGHFEARELPLGEILDELARLSPGELLVEDGPEGRDGTVGKLVEPFRAASAMAMVRRPAWDFSMGRAERRLLEQFGVATLEGLGLSGREAAATAAGALLSYLDETQRAPLTHVKALTIRDTADELRIDQHSWRCLEITRTLREGRREGTLAWAMDRTIHPIGARLLREWLIHPPLALGVVTARQNAVGYLHDDPVSRAATRDVLRRMADFERITARLTLGRATPRDVRALGEAVEELPTLRQALGECAPTLIEEATAAFDGLEDVATEILSALVPNPPSAAREGGVIARGHDAELDRLYAIGEEGQSWLAAYQRKEIDATGIPNLKVAYNRVFGYYIEVSHAQRDRIPAQYVRRQTLKNAERYITDELRAFEDEALTARERALSLEAELFAALCSRIAERAPRLMRAAAAVGLVDLLAGFAELAEERRYVRPEFTQGAELEIADGRHPVLEQVLDGRFVPNDLWMDGASSRMHVITGPNMAGKSTFIRQVALLTLMAQVGSFVPARAMRLGPVDRIFARVGASDELMKGRSTFMVEMVESAGILRNATNRSLVVLDEIGRGTSTYDGLAIAWAITESLALDTGCRGLVATHYHELIELADLIRGVRNYSVAVREISTPAGPPTDGGETPADAATAALPDAYEEAVVFLHCVVEGGADKSYGVHVARLAGLPPHVVRRAQQILDELQRGVERPWAVPARRRRRDRHDGQLRLFKHPEEAVIEALASLEPDQLSPEEALERLRALKKAAVEARAEQP